MTEKPDVKPAEETETATVTIEVDALPFTRINAERPDELLRQWIWQEIHGVEVPLTQSTLTYCEQSYQWITKGATEPKIKAVK